MGTLYNMVGFQTKLKHAEQVRVFRLIPGLERAEFARLGGLHRNTFVNSPRLLDLTLRMKAAPHVRLAGQITGCEGYVESAAVGLLAGRFAAAEALGEEPAPPPPETAHGALLAHITGGASAETYPADERQFRPVPAAAGGHAQERAQAGDGAPGAGSANAPGDNWRSGDDRSLALRAKIASSVTDYRIHGTGLPRTTTCCGRPEVRERTCVALPRPRAECRVVRWQQSPL